MALTDSEKQQIINALDIMDDWSKQLILASLDAFAQWLSDALYSIFLKVKNTLNMLFNWIQSQF